MTGFLSLAVYAMPTINGEQMLAKRDDQTARKYGVRIRYLISIL